MFSWLLLMQNVNIFQNKKLPGKTREVVFASFETVWFALYSWLTDYKVLHLLVMWGKTVIWKYRIYKVLFIAVSKFGIYLPVFLVLYFLRVTFSSFSISVGWKEIISKMADAVVWWTHRLNDKYGMNRSAASVFLDREKRYFTFSITFFWGRNEIGSDKNKH